MKNIASVNLLSIYMPVLTRYLDGRCEGDNVSPNSNLNFSQEFVTKLTMQETSDLFDHASRDRPRSVHKKHFSRIQEPERSFSRSRILEACESGKILCNPTNDFT